MQMLNKITENYFVNSLISNINRSPSQINKVHESDAEIIKINEDASSYLAVTIDSIVEEIKSGLYDNPYLIGWMSVIVNISDLAAVGANPLGILISQIIPSDYRSEDLKNLQLGIKDACRKCGTFILGGDTNTGENLIITGTAVGILENKKFNSRIGCQRDDIIYSTNSLGRGNAFAISRFFNRGNHNLEFLPCSGINYCRLIKGYASACMDTSDGVISTLDQLMRLNNIGFKLDDDWENKIDKESLELAVSSSIPAWLLLAGYHGEFELIFSIPKKLEEEFLFNAKKINWHPLKLGKVIKDVKIKIPVYGKEFEIDSCRIRNLINNLNKGVDIYLKSLTAIDHEMRSV